MLTVRCECANHSSFLTFLPTAWPHTSYNFPLGASDRVDIYNGYTGAWTTAVLSLARSFLSAVALPTQGLLVFAGGRTTTGASSRVDIFNGVSGSWITDELSTAREGFMGTSLPNLAIFAGGASKSGDELLGARGFLFLAITELPSFYCIVVTYSRHSDSSAIVDFFSPMQQAEKTVAQDARVSAVCNSCPAGSYSGPGDVSCTICPAGIYFSMF
jgi:hypothetical protein